MSNTTFMYGGKNQVVKVLDGDTFAAVLDAGLGISVAVHVRLAGINTPEMKGPDAAKAKAAKASLEALLAQGVGNILSLKWDKYGGRIVGLVWTPGGELVAGKLIKAGHVMDYYDLNGKRRATPAPFLRDCLASGKTPQ